MLTPGSIPIPIVLACEAGETCFCLSIVFGPTFAVGINSADGKIKRSLESVFTDEEG